jgi:WD40 repeat protein
MRRILIFWLIVFSFRWVSSLTAQTEPELVLPIGHTAELNSTRFSPCGSFIVTSSEDNTAAIWDSNTGKLIKILKGHAHPVDDAIYFPNGKYILTVSYNEIRVWDAETGLCIRKLIVEIDYRFQFVEISPDNSKIYAISDKGRLTIWETTKWIKILEKDPAEPADNGNQEFIIPEYGHVIIVGSAFDAKSSRIICPDIGDSLVNVIKLSVKAPFERKICLNHKEKVNTACFSPNGSNILTSSLDNIIRIWDSNSGTIISSFEMEGNVKSVMYGCDGSQLLAISDNNRVQILNSYNGKLLFTLQGHWAIFSPDGSTIFLLNGNSAELWDSRSGKRLHEFGCSIYHNNQSASFSPNSMKVAIIQTSVEKVSIKYDGCGFENNYDLSSFSIEKDGASIYSCVTGEFMTELDGLTIGVDGLNINEGMITSNMNYKSIAWDIKTGVPEDDYEKFKASFEREMNRMTAGEELNRMIGSNNYRVLHSETIFVGNVEQKFHIVSIDSSRIVSFFSNGRLLCELSLMASCSEISYCFDISPDGLRVLSKSCDGILMLDSESGEVLHTFNGDWGKFSNDGLKVICFQMNSIRIFEMESGTLLNVIPFESGLEGVWFSPNGHHLMTASWGEDAIQMWSIDSGAKTLEVDSVITFENSLVFSLDGRLLLIPSFDGTARIYDVFNGQEVQVLSGHRWVNSAIFSPDGKYILTTGRDHKTILWDAATGKSLYTRLQFEGKDWLVYDEHYRFDGTQGAIDQLYFVCGLEVVELNQVKDSLRVHNLVQRIMNGENLDHITKLSDLNICGVTPIVEPMQVMNLGNLGYRIIPRTGGVGDVEVYINGVVRYSTNARELKRKNKEYTLIVEEELLNRYRIAGEELRVKVIAKTANNSISSRGVLIEIEEQEGEGIRKPSLHAVMIGIDDYVDEALDLNYAAKDANDLQMVLKRAAQNFFMIDDTNRVFFYNLTRDKSGNLHGKTPDRGNLLSTLDTIRMNSKPEDIFLLFFAGHGEIVDKDQLLLLTAEARPGKFEGIRMRELLEQMNRIPAGKRVLILDACHSGAAINNLDMSYYTGKRDVGEAERQSQRLKELDKLASKSGFAIITASSSDQKALELPQYEHGLMTYALLSSMLHNSKALDEQSNLQLEKWLLATEEELRKLNTDQRAERVVPVNFTLGKVDDVVRNAIQLREIPTLHIKNVMNTDLVMDDLNIEGRLSAYFAVRERGGDKGLLFSDGERSNASNVNILYFRDGSTLNFKVTLLKNNQLQYQFTQSSAEEQLDAAILELALRIEAALH